MEISLSRSFICTPGNHIQKVISSSMKTKKIFITSRSLKHIYDRHIFEKRTPADFYILLSSLKDMANNPDKIYEDKISKRGSYIFVNKINKKLYGCIIENVNAEESEVVSAFVSGEKYLKKFALLWS
ncbi:MAG: hypothetical protein Q8Q03_00530 [bacterium]|nr:hypothetical protein [bacterium]